MKGKNAMIWAISWGRTSFKSMQWMRSLQEYWPSLHEAVMEKLMSTHRVPFASTLIQDVTVSHLEFCSSFLTDLSSQPSLSYHHHHPNQSYFLFPPLKTSELTLAGCVPREAEWRKDQHVGCLLGRILKLTPVEGREGGGIGHRRNHHNKSSANPWGVVLKLGDPSEFSQNRVSWTESLCSCADKSFDVGCPRKLAWAWTRRLSSEKVEEGWQ